MKEQEPPNMEILWRQYSLHIDLYKFYLELALKANLFFYGITGAIVSFYFANAHDNLIKYALLLPVVMSLAFAGLFFYGSTLLRYVREDIFSISDALGLRTAPDVQVLTVILRVFSIIFTIIAVALIVLMLSHEAA
jgi:hypothetical protein